MCPEPSCPTPAFWPAPTSGLRSSAGHLSAALGPAGARPRPARAAARRPAPGVRRLPAGWAAARRPLGITMAPVAGFPPARSRTGRAPRLDRDLATRCDRTGGDRLRGRARADRDGTGLPGHPRRGAQRRGGGVRPRTLRSARCRDVQTAALRRPVASGWIVFRPHAREKIASVIPERENTQGNLNVTSRKCYLAPTPSLTRNSKMHAGIASSSLSIDQLIAIRMDMNESPSTLYCAG